MELALIDGIGPFFRGFHARRINWSKIPLDHLATEGPERERQWDAIQRDLGTFAERVSAAGYNAVFLEKDAVWMDLNATVALRIFKGGATVEEAVAEFFGTDRAAAALELLRLSDLVILQLLYIEELPAFSRPPSKGAPEVSPEDGDGVRQTLSLTVARDIPSSYLARS
jgi:hypothetical protein